MERKGSFLWLFLLLGLLASPLPALADKPIIVGDGTAASCTEIALGDALVIAETVGGGTIKFRCGGPVTITVTATLVIPDNTTINGDTEVTLLGPNVIVASVSGNKTVTLKGLVISGQGCFFQCVGGVLNEGTLTVDNTTFFEINTQSGPRTIGPLTSALTNFGTLTVNNTTFRGNIGFGSAGDISNNPTGTLTVHNSTFAGQSGDFGSAIANAGTATVTNSTFRNSSGFLIAGSHIANSGTLHVKNCRFSFAGGIVAGGGIFSGGTLTVENSVFSPDDDAEFGGGLYNVGFASVRNSVFSGNHATFGFGGGIANQGTLELINSTVSGNSAIVPLGGTGGAGGGGILNAGTLEIVNSVVIDNSAADQGGGIFNAGALTIKNSIVTDNAAKVGGGIYMCLEGQVWGVGVPCHGTLTLKNTTVTDNTPDNIFPW